MPSYVTDRPNPDAALIQPVAIDPNITEPQPGTSTTSILPSHVIDEPMPGTSKNTYPSPEDTRPFQKAAPRKESNKGRKKRKSAILTDTPVKSALEEEQRLAKDKKIKTMKGNVGSNNQNQTNRPNIKKLLFTLKQRNKQTKILKKKIKKEPLSDSDEEDDDAFIV